MAERIRSKQAETITDVQERWRNPERFKAREGGRANQDKSPRSPTDPSDRTRAHGNEPDIGYD